MSAVTRHQIRAIHAAANALGMDDGAYRAMLEAWGVTSSRDLTKEQAIEVIDWLNGNTRATGRGRPPRLPAGATRLATPPQLALIQSLRGEIQWRVVDGFARWMKRSLGIDAIRTSAEAGRVIEALKRMRRDGL